MEKPVIIKTAVKLLWLILLLGVVKTCIEVAWFDRPVSTIDPQMAVHYLILAFLVVKFSAGRNWARIFLSLLLVLAGVIFVPEITDDLSAAPITGSLSIVQIVLGFFAIVFAWGKSGRAWFAKKRPAKAQPA